MTYKDQRQRLADLLDAFSTVPLTPEDNRLLGWLSSFPPHTTDAFAALVERTREWDWGREERLEERMRALRAAAGEDAAS